MSPPPLPEREDIALLEPFEGLGLKDIRVVASAADAADAAAARGARSESRTPWRDRTSVG